MTIEPGDTADKEVERVARAMAVKTCYPWEADMLVARLDAPQISPIYGFRKADEPNYLMPLWKCFEMQARAAIDELRPQSKIELVSAGRPVPYDNWMRDLRAIAHDLLRPDRDKQDDAQSI